MSERVKPDQRQHTIKLGGKVLVEGNAFFLRSTILRVIDEEIAVWRDDQTQSGVQSRYVLKALRARFEDADDE